MLYFPKPPKSIRQVYERNQPPLPFIRQIYYPSQDVNFPNNIADIFRVVIMAVVCLCKVVERQQKSRTKGGFRGAKLYSFAKVIDGIYQVILAVFLDKSNVEVNESDWTM